MGYRSAEIDMDKSEARNFAQARLEATAPNVHDAPKKVLT